MDAERGTCIACGSGAVDLISWGEETENQGAPHDAYGRVCRRCGERWLVDSPEQVIDGDELLNIVLGEGPPVRPTTEAERIIARYVAPPEQMRLAFTSYAASGFKRYVVGVTDRRFVLVRSAYRRIQDKGLAWSDPIDQVQLGERPFNLGWDESLGTGNVYIKVRRADGSRIRLNPRETFAGSMDSAAWNIERLYALVPGRF